MEGEWGGTIGGLTEWALSTNQPTAWMLPVFFTLARRQPNCQVGEIGMENAISTLAFLLGVGRNCGHVYSIDIAPCPDGLANIRESGMSKWHTFMMGPSNKMCFPNHLDILFIDGDHTYTSVAEDFKRHYPIVKPGGVVLLHDTLSFPGPRLFCQEKGIPMLDLGAGLGILQKPL